MRVYVNYAFSKVVFVEIQSVTVIIKNKRRRCLARMLGVGFFDAA